MSTPWPSISHAKSSLQRGHEQLFSGKLSPVTPMFDKQNQIEPKELPPAEVEQAAAAAAPREVGGREGPEPTRYGDWESRGRCIDF
jgi:hypothetical protein